MANERIPSEHRVVMAKDVASRWLETRTSPEYRIKVFYGAAHDGKGMGNLLRLYRDGKLKVGGIEPLADLGIQEEFDHIILWSSDRDAMTKLSSWFEARHFETTGVW